MQIFKGKVLHGFQPFCEGIDEPSEPSQAVGFSVSRLTNLPFKIESMRYISYWDELAQIEYTGSNAQQATYRKSVGTDDNSGQYDDFGSVKAFTQNGLDIVLKGEADAYVLSVWTDGEYEYSVMLSEDISEAAWLQIIAA